MESTARSDCICEIGAWLVEGEGREKEEIGGMLEWKNGGRNLIGERSDLCIVRGEWWTVVKSGVHTMTARGIGAYLRE